MPGDRLTTSPLITLTFIFALVACACGNGKAKDDKVVTTNPTSDAAPASKRSVDPPPPPTESDCAAGKETVSVADRFDCTADEDCVTTCQWGAVSWRGYKLLADDCEDGCASKGLNARCVESRCTSFDLAGKRIAGCSDIAAPEDVCVDPTIAAEVNQCKPGEKLVGTFSRFDCDVDGDCRNSCQYGAINHTWYDRLGPGCKDGCSSKGMHARCIANACVAFDHKDQRADDCTRQPAPDAICVPK